MGQVPLLGCGDIAISAAGWARMSTLAQLGRSAIVNL
jgi:hypothetical protein